MQTFSQYINESLDADQRTIDRLAEKLKDFISYHRLGSVKTENEFIDKLKGGHPIEPLVKKYVYGKIKKLCTDTEKFLNVHSSKNDWLYQSYASKKLGKTGYEVIADRVKEAKTRMEEFANWARSASIFYTAMHDKPDMIKRLVIDQLIELLAGLKKAKYFSLKDRKYIPYMKSFDPKKIRADFDAELEKTGASVGNLYVPGPFTDKDFKFNFIRRSKTSVPVLDTVETDI